jgi:hypothetical protein
MSTVIAGIAWWGPIAIAGGAAAGLLVAYLVLVFAGGAPTGSPISRRLAFERTEKTNYPTLNPAAFLFVFGVIGLIVGLAVGLSSG